MPDRRRVPIAAACSILLVVTRFGAQVHVRGGAVRRDARRGRRSSSRPATAASRRPVVG